MDTKTNEPQIDADGEGTGTVKVICDGATFICDRSTESDIGELGRVVVAPGLIVL
jgi:hypothetical protein